MPRRQLRTQDKVGMALAAVTMVACMGWGFYRASLTERLKAFLPTTDNKPGISEVDKTYFLSCSVNVGAGSKTANEALTTQDFQAYSNDQLRRIISAYEDFEQRKATAKARGLSIPK